MFLESLRYFHFTRVLHSRDIFDVFQSTITERTGLERKERSPLPPFDQEIQLRFEERVRMDT